MSNTDDLSEQKTIEQEKNQQVLPFTVKPFHRKFSAKLAALLLTIIVTLALIFILFYQQSERSRFLIDGELTPLKQQFSQLQTLQRANYIVDELLFNNSEINFVELQAELVTLNQKLLQLGSPNSHLYQQWLTANKLASDVAMRIQQGYGRNEQLKQSSVIQLQLMWFSITPIINKKIAQQKLLFKQLEADRVNDKLTLSRTNAYVSAIRTLHNLQQLRRLLADVLASFEQLTIHTSMDDFDLLRISVEQILAQRKVLKINDKTKAMVDFNQQIDTFEKIVITEQRALAKWQGFIRLTQNYQLELKIQKNQLMQLLAKPQEEKITYVSSVFNDWKIIFNIKLTEKELSIILLLAISLSLLFFCYLLWRLRQQIKISSQESVALIQKSIHAENSSDIEANCAETQEIMQQVQFITKPEHDEEEFQQLLQQCQAYKQVIDEQAQTLVEYAERVNQQQVDTSDQVKFHLQRELQCYKHLEGEVLSFIQQQQAKLINEPSNNEIKTVPLGSLVSIYEQLRQFYLASDMCSENAVLTLADVNLVDVIHAILINKQVEQQKFNNQLYFSYDDQLLVKAMLDFRLFEQLMHLFIDVTLRDCRSAQLHLHLTVQDKNEGQQLVRFAVIVKAKNLEALPELVALLIESQTSISQKSPLVDMLNVLLTKQYGDNVIAQLVDDGFQLSFELPLAIGYSPVLKKQQDSRLDGIKVMLLSSNKILIGLIEKIIKSDSGQFEVLTRRDSLEQQLTAKYLSKHKLDLLILASDVEQQNIDLITQQLKNFPNSLQPKVMLLQSAELNFDDFGIYSQTEQLLFKDTFLHNIEDLLTGEASNNQLISPEQCQQNYYLASKLSVLLAVSSPEEYQNFQRLLRWLGLRVHVVSHADAQRELWKTGMYCILFTEFPETSLLKMERKPLVDIAIFSLVDILPNRESNAYFDGWHIEQFAEQQALAELSAVLAPWLKCSKLSNSLDNSMLTSDEEHIEFADDEFEGHVITELVASLAEDNKEAVFDFSQYLHHHGSVELALFMLDDYTQDNHQQLDFLVDAIKARNFTKAKEAIIDLELNAKILAASKLKQLCYQWSKLLNGNEVPSSLMEVNILLKETRTALTHIDSYAESI